MSNIAGCDCKETIQWGTLTGAVTFSKTALSIKTHIMMDLFPTLSIMTFSMKTLSFDCH
jgi:hypothetical protein